eukprot:CAMPEP_0173400702 /NCGR_PEP_ID=MMETSP1356-20130122/48689_1 /TAXON_ID=77927 ORGANISM="Hemiselmis virescens, Strain PCC157" /NCGR_SAMPLE_ID=MMETSP1356 /ASSEMBLY_ACC=CAM_ASM_000847 /LENGTH=59 /DNA_ID=CAMNT_0014360675 /DNA_START=105 /DNA_END=280 /DNA_ORIENTATION=-
MTSLARITSLAMLPKAVHPANTNMQPSSSAQADPWRLPMTSEFSTRGTFHLTAEKELIV